MCSATSVRSESAPLDPAQAIDAYMNRTVPFGFSGSLLVARHGNVLLARGYGLADRDRGIRYSRATVFPIGSLTKQFTAAAILKLETRGLLKATDPITKYLPGVPADKAAITIHELLTHTSGLESDAGQDYDTVTRDQFLGEALSQPLRSGPGRNFSYSNAGYGLLAAIVEIIAGQPYQRYLSDSLFSPAGMTSTGDADGHWNTALLAHGYEDRRDVGNAVDLAHAQPGPHWNLLGSGGILSTLDDLYRWDRALSDARVLSKNAEREMFSPYVVETPGRDVHYAYGWYVSTTPWRTRLIAHTGGDGVFFAGIRRYVDDDVTIIHSSNVASVWSEYPVRTVEDILFGRPYELPPEVVAMPANPGRFAGTFCLPSGDPIIVEPAGPELRATPAGQEAFEALAGTPARDDSSMTAYQRRTTALLDQRDHGDFAPLAAAMMDSSNAATLSAGWEEYKRSRRPTSGDYRGFSVLGSRPAHAWTITYVRLHFERGSELFEYLWNGDKLAGVQFSSYPGYFSFLPTGEMTFASYDIRSGKSVSLSFTGAAMTITSPDRTLRAVRR
jgi:CubicO group peptidase (beta-lactamase class C family)